MAEERDSNRGEGLTGSQAKSGAADQNERFKPPTSATDLPAQAHKPAQEDDNTNSSSITRQKARNSSTDLFASTNTGSRPASSHSAGSQARSFAPTGTQAKAQPPVNSGQMRSASARPTAGQGSSQTPKGQAAEQKTGQTSAQASKSEQAARPAAQAQSATQPAAQPGARPAARPTSARQLPDLPDLREDAGPSSASPASRAEFTTVYDILDKMEAMLDEAKSSMFAPSIAKIDREEFLDALADLKKMLPVQLERASALMRESERRLDGAQTQSKAIISEAQSQAADIVKEAGEQAEFLAGQENVVAIAQRKAQAIIDQAQAQSDKLVQGANEYSAKVMEALSSQLEHYQQDVQAGIEVLHERERQAASKLDQSYAEGN